MTTCYAVLAVLLWQTEMLAGESSWPTQPLQVVIRQDNQADLLEQLLGVWEFRTPDGSVVGTGIFTAEGILPNYQMNSLTCPEGYEVVD
ncbi:MAG: hypothetical protein AAFY20_25895 [Cyanobacteria bacterium J06639_14]